MSSQNSRKSARLTKSQYFMVKTEKWLSRNGDLGGIFQGRAGMRCDSIFIASNGAGESWTPHKSQGQLPPSQIICKSLETKSCLIFPLELPTL